MFEVLGQYFLGECVLINHDKADAVECPFDNMLVLVILNGGQTYIEKLVGLFEEARNGSRLALGQNALGGESHHRLSSMENIINQQKLRGFRTNKIGAAKVALVI